MRPPLEQRRRAADFTIQAYDAKFLAVGHVVKLPPTGIEHQAVLSSRAARNAGDRRLSIIGRIEPVQIGVAVDEVGTDGENRAALVRLEGRAARGVRGFVKRGE